ncbi:hypothetical protein [Paraburkholderia caribensis]|uniref:hypothetical protein n=1 Tax=Paraburkholderia caribensis TaxID=75105 RepID=UPI0015912397|nr:hypothetical protein [Paraburkholderia caribensis]
MEHNRPRHDAVAMEDSVGLTAVTECYRYVAEDAATAWVSQEYRGSRLRINPATHGLAKHTRHMLRCQARCGLYRSHAVRQLHVFLIDVERRISVVDIDSSSQGHDGYQR